jgi:hypothetical protein
VSIRYQIVPLKDRTAVYAVRSDGAFWEHCSALEHKTAKSIASTLNGTTPITGFSISRLSPCVFDIAEWTAPGWPATLYGTGFTAELADYGSDNLYIQFTNSITTWAANAVTFVSETELAITVLTGGVTPPPTVGSYDVSFWDAGGILMPDPIVLTGGAGVIDTSP